MSDKNTINSENECQTYINAVVNGILARFPENFKKYTGMTAKSVEETIDDIETYTLIKRSVCDLYEYDIPVEEAVEELSSAIDCYFTAIANVM